MEKYRGWMMNRLINVWGGKRLFVKNGTPPRTDGKRVILPLNEEWEDLRVYAQHESSHLRFSNFKAYKKAISRLSEKFAVPSQTVAGILNLLEDYRCESLFPEIFPGSAKEFRRLNEKLLKIHKPDENNPMTPITSVLYGVPLEYSPDVAKYEKLGEEIKKTIDKYKTFASVVAGAYKILKTIPREAKPLEFTFQTSQPEGCESDNASPSEAEAIIEILERKEESEDEEREEKDESEEREESEDEYEDSAEESKDDEGDTEDDETDETDEGGGEESEEETEDTEDGDGDRVADREDEESEGESKAGEEIGEDDDELARALEEMKSKIESYINEERRKIEEKEEKKGGEDIHFKKPSEYSYKPVKYIVREVTDILGLNRTSEYTARLIYRETVTRYSREIQQIQRELEQIRGVRVDTWARSGKVSMNKAVSTVASGNVAIGQIFRRKHETTGVDVVILVDQSGSMGGERIETATDATIILAEALSSIPNVRFGVYGFWSMSSSGWRPYYTVEYKSLDSGSERNWLIGAMRSQKQNRDGYHIRVVADILQKQARPGAKKVFIMLSDGEPHDGGTEYEGEIAIEDTRKAVNEVRQKGIILISVAIDIGDRESFNRMYGDTTIFVNTKNLVNLFKKLPKLIQTYTMTI